ncbi:MarR family winged helix-turn-helix transcriptional regulator [Antarcticirhabdus aurantiaca]|uniref:MarR family transcriptional regulator n=1 Tax=Antarcticirhabdus aurantiaca TaxID=2606717 RepID=A0ACD4NS13_9HYPH|nr:MarR family transcriptional regulator [Antarcticirhabdus aurantiaca]WAJ29522.1 MarR family transcriptional regulator [Jeongeuplla avenae]
MSAAGAWIALPDVADLQLVSLLVPISKHVRALLDLKLQDIGLEVGQDQLLLELSREKTQRSSKLAEKLAIRPSTLSKMADKLAAKGFVMREKTPDDRRLTILRLTEEGGRMKDQVRRIHSSLNDELAVDLQVGESGRALEALTAIADTLARRLARLR